MLSRVPRIRLLVAALVGIVAWSGPRLLIPVSLAIPVLIATLPVETRRHRAYVAFAYYAAALWPVVAAGVQLYGWHAIPFLVVVTGMAALVLAACWLLPGTVLPMGATALPPIGIIGVASPLTSAGVLFPGMAWFGLVSTAVVPFGLKRHPTWTAPTVLALSLVLNGAARDPEPPAGWRGVDTRFGDIRSKREPAAEFRSACLSSRNSRSPDGRGRRKHFGNRRWMSSPTSGGPSCWARGCRSPAAKTTRML